MEVRFWGVRGSVATSGSHVARIGGNTSCVELSSHGEQLILDAGTGLKTLGDAMMARQPVKATVLWSHMHWDHVQGFPFFTPAYLPNTELTLYGPGANGAQALREVLSKQMEPPNFPVPLAAMRSKMTFNSALPHHAFEVGPFRVTPFEIPHPQGCMGYHVEADGQRFVYMTDVEVSPATLTPDVRKLLEGANALVLDGQYTPDEYAGTGGMGRKGWGHSTMIDAAKIAKESSVGRLFLFHHDPSRTDDQVENMAEEARSVFSATEPAREGKQVRVA